MKERLENNVDVINNLRSVEDSGDLNTKVKKVAVILCGSRNGSSLLKSVVSKSKELAYLAGEEEPYLILSKNGYPFNSNSDKITEIQNKQHLLNCIFDEMGVNGENPTIKQIQKDWWNRMFLQIPYSENFDLTLIEDFTEDLFNYIFRNEDFNWEEVNQVFLKNFLEGKQDYGYYDIVSENTPYLINAINKFKIEEPPYVIPGWKRQINEDDLDDKCLFFKTPQDCYRIGMFEELFPNAEIKYIHLSRGFAQTVNGLMDGWMSETGFFAHNMEGKLKIDNYSDKVKGGDTWWKFDLPPNWEEYAYDNKSLEEVCLNQWHSAHSSILESGVDALRIKFEDFLKDDQAVLNQITDYLDISPIKVEKLPVIMATNTPSSYRWYKRKDAIMKLSEQKKVKDLMNNLGYSMDPETWI